MGRRILAVVFSIMLIFALPVFSFAEEAAAGDSGVYGYNIEPLDVSYRVHFGAKYVDGFNYGVRCTLPAGKYAFKASFNSDFSRFRVLNSSYPYFFNKTFTDSSISDCFTLDESLDVYIFGFFSGISEDDIDLLEFSLSRLVPVDGISSGYTLDLDMDDSSLSATGRSLMFGFGEQPPGEYAINIYHSGVRCIPDYFQIVANGRSLPSSTNGGVTTFYYTHGGGDMSFTGYVSVSYSGSGASSSSTFKGITNYDTTLESGPFSGSISTYSKYTYSFSISDIIAVSLDSAGLEQYGVFGGLVGFFRDQFSDMKSFLSTQFDRIAGDESTKSDVDQAQDSLDKDVQEVSQLSSDLSSHTSNLTLQFETDFSISSDILSGSSSVQVIYNFLFDSLGIYSIFIWLPVVLVVIKKLLRL